MIAADVVAPLNAAIAAATSPAATLLESLAAPAKQLQSPTNHHDTTGAVLPSLDTTVNTKAVPGAVTISTTFQFGLNPDER